LHVLEVLDEEANEFAILFAFKLCIKLTGKILVSAG